MKNEILKNNKANLVDCFIFFAWFLNKNQAKKNKTTNTNKSIKKLKGLKT